MTGMVIIVDLADEQATMEFAGKLAQSVASHNYSSKQQALVIFLRGDLGAGKTTFTRGFLRACGYEGIVKSPTYTLVEPYIFDKKPVYHFDLYRLGDPEELEFTGARDCFTDDAVCLIEWPEKAAAALPEADIDCEIHIDGIQRQLSMRSLTSTGESLMLQSFPD